MNRKPAATVGTLAEATDALNGRRTQASSPQAFTKARTLPRESQVHQVELDRYALHLSLDASIGTGSLRWIREAAARVGRGGRPRSGEPGAREGRAGSPSRGGTSLG